MEKQFVDVQQRLDDVQRSHSCEIENHSKTFEDYQEKITALESVRDELSQKLNVV
jgi:hypothetical protein